VKGPVKNLRRTARDKSGEGVEQRRDFAERDILELSLAIDD
jgi:hypothetical protein